MKYITVFLGIAAVATARLSDLHAAQQTFWPLDQWPPPTWTLATTNDNSVPFFFTGGVTVFIRHLQLSNLLNPIIPPALTNSSVYSFNNAILNYELSIDNGTWFPVQATGPVSFRLYHSSDSGADRIFDLELLSASLNGTSPFGVAFLRDSPTLQSLGTVVMTTTTGGFLVGADISVRLEISTDFGQTWTAAAVPANLELSGPPGVPATLSIFNLDAANILLSWTTQTNVNYQLQSLDSLTTTNWNNVGVPTPGTPTNLVVTNSILGAAQKFYRVALSP